MAISVSPKMGVGTRLREARARRGVDLLEASRVTRIKTRYLEALEHDAPPRTFRAPVYARAFLREYARYLGLNPEPLVEEYRTEHGERDPLPTPLPSGPSSPRRPPIGQIAAAVILVAALVALVTVAARDTRRGVPEPVVAPAPAPVEEPPAAPPPPAAEEVRLGISLEDGPSWMLVVVDGEVAVRGKRKQGFERVFRGDRRIRVEIGDAGATRLSLNGEDLGNPGPSRVAYRASYVLRGGEVRVVSAS